jgi:hypothetical protein
MVTLPQSAGLSSREDRRPAPRPRGDIPRPVSAPAVVPPARQNPIVGDDPQRSMALTILRSKSPDLFPLAARLPINDTRSQCQDRPESCRRNAFDLAEYTFRTIETMTRAISSDVAGRATGTRRRLICGCRGLRAGAIVAPMQPGTIALAVTPRAMPSTARDEAIVFAPCSSANRNAVSRSYRERRRCSPLRSSRFRASGTRRCGRDAPHREPPARTARSPKATGVRAAPRHVDLPGGGQPISQQRQTYQS